ncbi:MAG: DUF2807 domain-containing protein [Planctomycetota bacterium]|nr:DUF2807 domain-containing protein [Planctomycetota bacterium]
MKNHPTYALLAAVALSLGLSSCLITIDGSGTSLRSGFSTHSSKNSYGPTHKGSGTRAEDPRALASFDRISLEGNLDLDITVTKGAEQSVLVSGEDNLLEFVRTEVRDGVLHVDLDSGSYRMSMPLMLHATVPALGALTLQGSGDIIVRGLDAEAFQVKLEGSGDIAVAGRVERLSASLEGSGDLDLAALLATEASVSLEGSGDIRLSASEKLTIQLEGSGDIGYRGNPRVKLSMSGSGDVYSFD